MRIDPDQPTGSGTPPTDGPKSDKPPKKDFPPIKEKKKKHEGHKEEKSKGLGGLFNGKQQSQTERVEMGKGGSLAGRIDKLVAIFQDPANRFFASAVSHVGVSTHGAETHVNIMLQSGINIEINMRADDLNITIRGISAELQSAMDDQAHQRSLQDQLRQAGFTVHQITTVRGDQPAATVTAPSATDAATADLPEGEPGGGETGGEGGTGGEEGPPER